LLINPVLACGFHRSEYNQNARLQVRDRTPLRPLIFVPLHFSMRAREHACAPYGFALVVSQRLQLDAEGRCLHRPLRRQPARLSYPANMIPA
jgi:hypothetical protein